MKPIYKISLVALALIGLSACNQEQKTASADKVELSSVEQKEAYSVGASIGRYMAGHIKEQEELGFSVDRALIVTGFQQGLKDELQLTEDEMQKVLEGLDQKLNEKRMAKVQEMAAKSMQESKAYLEQNKAKEGVITTESGLQYEVLTPGEGEKPAAEDIVTVHYRGTLIDGTEFDSSYSRGEPAEFALNRVIPGWTEGVQLMPVGAKYRFVIPSELAYGERDMGTIPANSTLIFEVELLKVKKAEAPVEPTEAEASAK
ncbi:MAG: FKBP-type peptidyl-prolyl cis-trans isomerase [Shewanella algae]|jgi:FKBP-type peptidyl-prolyl cis-trans isomerase FkpA|uniref:Peptidyl-prolyl cis-trans isomerase n=1 Tax=Shewanella chilikensis TaxID=558541 RepID=A0A6G7LPA8_9GAMM|nr:MULTISPECIES: FKBP-type peptidyl-prolyl cis-trans isomerase [Shewanella]MBO2585633.1 FKBP-type peptidyl-prolyl cis-trans isomerase [Shewanella algae]MBZ4678889.1 peptidylprolyl isomerase [Shewanella sp.]MCA0951494.1 FKBP-type peptidyl-prolyl cis-trans isomerase [Shewanella chilikensis]MCE9853312.1 FKBP-type peptidyl-prolyl cis-trans isomerase [Shewanella chilikensis]MCL1163483.1 FKBP-type peptidyl-prolyl cis-trans isomerase [Shewanella chilikensis]